MTTPSIHLCDLHHNVLSDTPQKANFWQFSEIIDPLSLDQKQTMTFTESTGQLLENESPRTDQPVEWWFVQGRIEEENGASREFMISLFRHTLEWKGLHMGHACTFIASSLDLATLENNVRSVVAPSTIPFVARASRHYPPPGLDPQVVAVVAEELEQYGPPSPIFTEIRKPVWKKKSLCVEWGSFRLEQQGDSLFLEFEEPGHNHLCRFQLTPQHPRIHLTKVEVPEGGAMDYVSYTRMTLKGTADSAPVKGTAWFDHQWGSQGWVVGGKEQERILGWDWLGIQLKDGRDLILGAHRDMRDRSILKKYAVLISTDGASSLHHDLELTPLAWWTAPLTGAIYPVEWDIRIASLDLTLHFTPATLDQEIPMLPPMRAVWEGAGVITGHFQGKKVEGWARLELHGYAYLIDASRHMENVIKRVTNLLSSYLPRKATPADLQKFWHGPADNLEPDAITNMILQPLWHMLDLDRQNLWYSLTGNLMTAALGTNPAPFELLSAVTSSMMVAGAKILDDIQDNAATRNGQPTVHQLFNHNTALLAGTTALFLPMHLLADYPGLTDRQRLELYQIFHRCCLRAHLGQAQDLHWSGKLTEELLADPALEQKILACYKGKDSIFTEAAMEGAAALAGADSATRAACLSYGTTLGLALGIRNDVGDFSPMNIAAHEGGLDLAEGKASFVIARALSLLKGNSRTKLRQLCCHEATRKDPAALREGIQLIVASGALESCLKTARLMMEKEWEHLSAVLPPSEPKTMLRVLWSLALAPLNQQSSTAFIAPPTENRHEA